MKEGAWNRIAELEQALAHERGLREAAELEVRRAAETYVVALDVSEQHWRKQCEATERQLDCGLGDFAIEQGEPCKYGPYPNNCQCCRTIAATRRAEAAEVEIATLRQQLIGCHDFEQAAIDAEAALKLATEALKRIAADGPRADQHRLAAAALSQLRDRQAGAQKAQEDR